MKKKHIILFALFSVAVLIGTTVVALAQDQTPNEPNAPQEMYLGFSYQGRLEAASGPYDGSCDMRFGLYDAYLGGNQLGSTLTVTGISVNDGYFHETQLDFGIGAFNGETRFLQIEVRCPAGTGGYTLLSPRQMIMAAPVAMSLQGLYTKWNSTSPNIIGGFNDNTISGAVGGTISGGGNASQPHQITESYGTIGGGLGNTISGIAATIPGGQNNTAMGDFSLAAGKNARANHNGSFVWSDSRLDEDFESLREYQFRVQAAGGAQFQDGEGNWIEFLWGDLIRSSSGASLSLGGTWTNASDVNLKQNFSPVNSQAILERLATMPNQSWNYKSEGAEVRHIGPTAQDFYSAFGLGGSNTSISTVDADGISLAAIQGLYKIAQDQANMVETLQAENSELQARVTALETKNSESNQQTVLHLWLPSGILVLLFILERFIFKRPPLSLHSGR